MSWTRPVLRSALVAAITIAGAFLLAGCGDNDDGAPSLGGNANTEGQRLAEGFFGAIASGDADQVDRLISPGFVLVRANGDVHDRDSYLPNLPTLNQFSISEVRAVQTGDILVVSYLVTTDQVIDGQQQPTNPAPRLSTFAWEDGQWRLISHANFNAIVPGNR